MPEADTLLDLDDPLVEDVGGVVELGFVLVELVHLCGEEGEVVFEGLAELLEEDSETRGLV